MSGPRLLSRNWDRPDSHTLAAYRRHEGYASLQRALESMTPEEVVQQVVASGLQGRGGAGFPTGRKWSFLPSPDGGPRYLVVNADEGEPGTFKDRAIMERDPHMLIEGMLIAAYAIRATEAVIYVRGEYLDSIRRLEAALEEAREAGLLGDRILGSELRLATRLIRGAGAYICGEETAMLESIEGRKGWPRLKPPFPAVRGLYGRPTIIHNVETLACLPHVLAMGGEAYAALGTPGNGGTRLFAVSGDVERPGVVELPMGTPLREVIRVCGGVRGGKPCKAVIPGGVSAMVLTEEDLDLPMDFTSCQRAGTMLGSGAVIVMDEDRDLLDALVSIMGFFARESCGQCTPCREGSAWAWKLLRLIQSGQGRPGDLETLLEIARDMEGTTICPMGTGAAWALGGMIRKFRAEFDQALTRSRRDE